MSDLLSNVEREGGIPLPGRFRLLLVDVDTTLHLEHGLVLVGDGLLQVKDPLLQFRLVVAQLGQLFGQSLDEKPGHGGGVLTLLVGLLASGVVVIVRGRTVVKAGKTNS